MEWECNGETMEKHRGCRGSGVLVEEEIAVRRILGEQGREGRFGEGLGVRW